LARGLADACRAAGIPCFGPVQADARLESSKIFAKDFMVRHRVPTGGVTVVDSAEACRAAIPSYPTVLKYNGLAAGKGVAVCLNPADADEFIDLVFTRRQFGDDQVFVEEFLEGKEVSVICAVSGGQYLYFTPARDYKRLLEDDHGPNTGGMGAVASRRLLPPELIARIEREVIQPTVRGLVADGMDYRGFLYFGIILTAAGPKVLEFNCRFGDPEAQAVLPIVEGDFAGFLLDAARGKLSPDKIRFHEGWSITLVKASGNYPQGGGHGEVISGLDQVKRGKVFHAGTRLDASGRYTATGGRVLAVTCTGATREEARQAAYAEAARITWDGARQRGDIGSLHFEDHTP
jgi:phosphoribosylamine--glycine ligase